MNGFLNVPDPLMDGAVCSLMSLCVENSYIGNLSKTRVLKLLDLLEFGW